MKDKRVLAVLAIVVALLIGFVWLGGRSLAPRSQRRVQAHKIQEPEAVVHLHLPQETLTAGDVLTLTVHLSSASANLSAFQFDLGHVSSRVAYVGSAPGDLLGSTGRQVLCPPPAVLTDTVRLACASAGDSRGAVAPGDLAVVTFDILEGGDPEFTVREIKLISDARPPKPLDGTVVILGTTDAPKLYLPLILQGRGGVQ